MQQRPASSALSLPSFRSSRMLACISKTTTAPGNHIRNAYNIVKLASFPITDSRIVTVVGNMGHVQYAKGSAAASMGTAIMIYKQCLRLQRSLSSRDLLAEANTMSKIGFIFRQGGRLDTAITWYEDALEVRTEVLGDDHVGLSSDLLAIGNSTTVRENLTAPLLPFQSACRLTAPHLLTAA